MTKFDEALSEISNSVEEIAIRYKLSDVEVRDILDLVQGEYQ